MKRFSENLVVVIMAGGAGTRFWPLSTEELPKQFLSLLGDKSLLRMSYERAASLVPPERVLVLTNRRFTGLVKEQLPELPASNVIGEPERKDTAAAVALAAAIARHRFGNPVILTLTADHLIEPLKEFQKALLSAARAAEETGALYTFGIMPSYPATGYGYLKRGESLLQEEGVRHFRLQTFKEKPDPETASEYVASGDYYWNSGMFAWSAEAVIKEIETHLPEHARELLSIAAHEDTPEWDELLARAFAALSPVSVDFGVMEKAAEVRCVESNFSWSDVGGWAALADHLPADEAGNCCRGEVLTLDAEGNLVFCEDGSETVLLVGVSDLVIVRAGDKTLVAKKDRAEELKKLVEGMKKS
ncbi:MAG: sugar phosphate nucleotidyltransferase [bacterium]